MTARRFPPPWSVEDIALVYSRVELDVGNARNDIIDRAQLMQSNLETISKLERKYREYTGELRRRYL